MGKGNSDGLIDISESQLLLPQLLFVSPVLHCNNEGQMALPISTRWFVSCCDVLISGRVQSFHNNTDLPPSHLALRACRQSSAYLSYSLSYNCHDDNLGKDLVRFASGKEMPLDILYQSHRGCGQARAQGRSGSANHLCQDCVR
jgi:hypothetical protein